MCDMCGWQDTDDPRYLYCSSPHHGLHPPPFGVGAKFGYDVMTCVAYSQTGPRQRLSLDSRLFLIPSLHGASCHLSHVERPWPACVMVKARAFCFRTQMNYYIHWPA